MDKKTPKRILSSALSMSLTSSDVQIAQITPKKEKARASKTFVSPFFILKIRIKNAIMTNEKMFIICALFCQTPIRDKSGIKTVPPPSPIAPSTPDNNPKSINNANIFDFLFRFDF